MARISEKMDQHTVRRALGLVGTDTEIADTQVPGLSIRVRKTSAAWCVRGRLGPAQTVYTLAPVEAVGGLTVTAARDRALEVKRLLRAGTDPRPWLAECANGRPTERTFTRADGMEWEAARDKFLEHIKADRAAKTYQDYQITLTSPDLDAWKGRLIKHITAEDLKRVRAAIAARGKRVQSAHTVTITKSCFSWLAETPDTGITESPMLAVRPSMAAGKAKRAEQAPKLGRVRTKYEVGALVWRLDTYAGPPSARLEVALMLFTAQRVETVLSAEKMEFDGECWRVPAAHMKRGTNHTLPLSEEALTVASSAIRISSHPRMLFPATKKGRGDSEDPRLSYRAIRNAILRLPAGRHPKAGEIRN